MSPAVHIIIPCYNEEEGIERLLREINEIAGGLSEKIIVIIVDDGSVDNTLSKLTGLTLPNVDIRIISLQYNAGHQQAIAQGILFANELQAKNVIIMDGDGEDDPQTIPALISKKNFDIVHVVRGRRSESLMFRLYYSAYRWLFRMITKKKMNFGNFCMISDKVIKVLSMKSFVHFAAFLSKLNFRTATIVSDRRERIGGKGKMGTTGLVWHAFRSFAEYSESLLLIFMRLFIVMFVFFILTIGYIIYLKFFTNYPVIGWTSTFGMGLLTAAIICMGFFVTGILQLNITQRNNLPPVGQYKIIR